MRVPPPPTPEERGTLTVFHTCIPCHWGWDWDWGWTCAPLELVLLLLRHVTMAFVKWTQVMFGKHVNQWVSQQVLLSPTRTFSSSITLPLRTVCGGAHARARVCVCACAEGVIPNMPKAGMSCTRENVKRVGPVPEP